MKFSIKLPEKFKRKKEAPPKKRARKGMRIDLMKPSPNSAKKRLGRRSIRARLILAIIMLTVSISLISGVINGFTIYRSASENLETRLNENAAAYGLSTQNAIRIFRTKIEEIAGDASLSYLGTGEKATQKLSQMAEKHGFLSLSVAGPNGATNDLYDVSQREYFKRAVNGETYLSSTLRSEATFDMVLMVAAQTNYGGRTGVVLAALESDVFNKIVDGIKVGEKGYGLIADKNGKIIAHPDRAVVENETNYIEKAQEDPKYAELGAMFEHMSAGETGIEYVEHNGNNLAVSYQPIPDTDGWSIAVCADYREMMESFYTSLAMAVGIGLLSIIVGIGAAFLIAGPIVKPIVGLVSRVEALAEGDLHTPVPHVNSRDELEILYTSFSKTIESLKNYIGEITSILASLEKRDYTVGTQQEYQGDFAQIKDSLGGIVLSLNQVFTGIKESADQVAAGSDQVSYGAQALAAGAAEQAATVEQLNASVGEVARAAEENVANVRTAADYVAQASKGVSAGNTHMDDLTRAMGEVGASSAQIAGITKVIEDIAFQTNILALNAAIEAARAGAAGKGFAVVADEVRNLAAKSAEAARQTAELIQNSVQTVTRGAQIAAETARVLQSVGANTAKVTESFGLIERSSESQAYAVEQINQGIQQVSAVVQANAATAEESSASSEELSAQAAALQSEVDRFKLQGDIQAEPVEYTTDCDEVPEERYALSGQSLKY